MNLLVEISKKDEKWRKIAYNICKDKDLADELVQEMYLKINNIKKRVNDGYIVTIIKHLHVDNLRKKKYDREVKDFDVASDEEKDLSLLEQRLIEEAKKLKFYELELLDLSGEHSYRELADRYNINYGLVFKIVKEAKKKIWQSVEADRQENKARG